MGYRSSIILFFLCLHFCADALSKAPDDTPRGAAKDAAAKTADEIEPEVEFFFTEREMITIGVIGFVSKGGISQDKADVMAELLTDEISRMGDVKVIGESDILSIFDLERRKDLLGCDSITCMTEIGGALGVRWLVSGSVTLFGETYVLNLRLSDAERAQIVSRASRKVTGKEDLLLVELSKAAHELFAPVGERLGLTMAETVSTAARHPQPISQSPSAITVISREDIEASGASSIIDLLRLVPGMDVVITTPSYSSVSTRLDWTFENRNFLVLIDGREANTELLGYTFFEILPISLQDILRIEIIRGPGSSLYGANAFVGVISITTVAALEDTSAWMQLSGGEAGLSELGARVSTRFGPLGISLSAGGIHMGNFTDPNRLGIQKWKLLAAMEYRLPESKHLVLDAGFANGNGSIATSVGTFDLAFPTMFLRLAYESDDLKGQLYWSLFDIDGELQVPLEFNRTLLAELSDVIVLGQTLDGEVQWTPPRLIESLLIITGAGVRASNVQSDNFLDGETFTDINHPRYQEPGIDHWESRVGAFVHLEFAPADWITMTGGLRFDYNNITEDFFSPRLTAVFRPGAGHFIRAGVARSFRKPAFMETSMHGLLEFPSESPLTGTGRKEFQDFMTRVVGNRDLDNEDMVSFETGYLGQFLEGRLTLTLDLYCNINLDRITFEQKIVADESTGLPDLERSSFMYENSDKNMYTIGGELSVRYQISRHLSVMAWWSHRQVFEGSDDLGSLNPTNTLAAGGRFRTDSGLVGSLYAFSRSEFWDTSVENPAGILEPLLKEHVENSVLLLSKIGWKIHMADGYDLEAGVKLFLPISLDSPRFRYRERGGGLSLSGRNYGGEELARLLTSYLQGSF